MRLLSSESYSEVLNCQKTLCMYHISQFTSNVSQTWNTGELIHINLVEGHIVSLSDLWSRYHAFQGIVLKFSLFSTFALNCAEKTTRRVCNHFHFIILYSHWLILPELGNQKGHKSKPVWTSVITSLIFFDEFKQLS